MVKRDYHTQIVNGKERGRETEMKGRFYKVTARPGITYRGSFSLH